MSNWTEKKIDHASISSPAEVAQVGSGFSRQLSGSQFALAGQDCYNTTILRYWFREARPATFDDCLGHPRCSAEGRPIRIDSGLIKSQTSSWMMSNPSFRCL